MANNTEQDNNPKIDEFAVNRLMLSLGFKWDIDRPNWYNEDNVRINQKAARSLYQSIESEATRRAIEELKKSLDEHTQTCGAIRTGDPRDWCNFQEVVKGQITLLGQSLKQQGDKDE